jgi:hypothetical protein
MDMKTWLAETAHATTSLIPLIWAEHEAVEVAAAKLKALEQETEQGYRQSAAFMEEFDDEGLATAIHWDTYFGPDKERHHAAIDLNGIEATLEARSTSRSSIASALLQIATHGLSAVHGGLAPIPAGRSIHGVDLKDLIWQGRNQAMHWEEGHPHKGVVACFDVLKIAADPVFGDYATRSLAFDVVALLEWRDQAGFEADLLSLA